MFYKLRIQTADAVKHASGSTNWDVATGSPLSHKPGRLYSIAAAVEAPGLQAAGFQQAVTRLRSEYMEQRQAPVDFPKEPTCILQVERGWQASKVMACGVLGSKLCRTHKRSIVPCHLVHCPSACLSHCTCNRPWLCRNRGAGHHGRSRQRSGTLRCLLGSCRGHLADHSHNLSHERLEFIVSF